MKENVGIVHIIVGGRKEENPTINKNADESTLVGGKRREGGFVEWEQKCTVI